MNVKNQSLGLLLLIVVFMAPKIQADPEIAQLMVIGLNASGEAQAFKMPKTHFLKNIGLTVSTVQESVLPPLTTMSVPESLKPNSLELRTIGVGVGLSGQFGLGPIFNVTFTPRIRLIFTNSTSPVYLD